MAIEQTLLQRSDSSCELCGSKENLAPYEIPPVSDVTEENSILICEVCRSQISDPSSIDPNHWRCLNAKLGLKTY